MHHPPKPAVGPDCSDLVARIDLGDQEFHERPHESLDALRACAPVHQDREMDRVVLTRARDVAAALADRGLSCDPFKARQTAYSRRRFRDADRASVSLNHLDDPEHARLRAAMTHGFGRLVDGLRPRVEAAAAELVDGPDWSAPVDLMETLAAPLPCLAVSALLGIDDADLAQIKRWSTDLTIILSPRRTEERQRRYDGARDAIDLYFKRSIERARSSPSPGLLGTLVAAEGRQGGLTELEIINNCRLLLVAGNVTTTDLIGNGAVALLRHPAQLDRVRGSPGLWDAAIEEILRYDPPVMAWNRQCPDARQIGGCPVEAGQTLTMLLTAANHDPALHDDPHAFDIGRENQRHYSFGGGAHSCPGATLARMVTKAALSALFDRSPRPRLASDRNLRRNAYPGFSGYEAVWLTSSS